MTRKPHSKTFKKGQPYTYAEETNWVVLEVLTSGIWIKSTGKIVKEIWIPFASM